MAATVDFNTIPYDAPLSFPEPSGWWKRLQSHRGATRAKVQVPATPEVDIAGKWIIITGSNNGIGREAALQFAKWGANLILGCRDPPPTETHPNEVVEECLALAKEAGHEKAQVEWWEINMADFATVEAFAKRWLDTGRPLDILCNNAGIGSSPGGKTIFKTKDGFEIIHQVNLLSHALLTLTLLPALAKATAPRVICTTSCFHFPGVYDLTNFNGEKGLSGEDGVQYYMNNKLFLQTWLTELQRRLLQHDQYKHITVNGIHPGYVNSGIWNLNKHSALKIGALKVMAYFLAISTQQGSTAITFAATTLDAGPDPKVQGVGPEGGKGGGRYFNRVWEAEPMPHTRDQDYKVRVWRKVNDELQLEKKGLLDVLGVKYVA